MPTTDQLVAANNSIQQLMQEAIKAGMDPITAASVSLFPMLDPYQMMNAAAGAAGKGSDNIPQMPPQLPGMPPHGEMEKLLKSMGLPPELAMVPGLLPPNMMVPPVSTSTVRSERRQSPTDAKSSSMESSTDSSGPSKAQTLPEKDSFDKSIASMLGEKRSSSGRKGGSKLDAMFGLGGAKAGDEKSSGKVGVAFILVLVCG